MAMSPAKLSIEDDDPWEVSRDIFNRLCDFIQPSTSLSPTTAASSLNALYPENRVQGDGKKESPESFLLEMWDVVIKVAVQLEPGSPGLERLALLIKTIRDVKPERTLHVWDSPVILWKDLPLLRPAMTERLNQIPNNALFSDHEAWVKDRQQIQSFHAFAAQLTRDGFDCISHACASLSVALEYPTISKSSTSGTIDSPSRRPSGPALKAVVAMAEFWISQCGEGVHERCKQDGTSGSVRGPLWQGKEGFSADRYRFWQRRFGEIAGDEDVHGATRELAGRAEVGMRRLEIVAT